MKVWVRGGGAVLLSKKNFVAQGGQAAVYAHKGRAYKIYFKPEHMLAEGKIQELSRITDPRVIRPEEIVLNKERHAIGYTMRHVPDCYALCQLFPRAFREREQLGPKAVVALVEELRRGIERIHEADVLLVDGNEMNFLVTRDFKELFFVDVDSYQTPNYPASAIMDSIRDRHRSDGDFSQQSDWFSFAIVAFQMFVGIHPYKGKHASCYGLDARMLANISVFDPSVRVPRAAYDFDAIPLSYRQWFQEVFERGLRSAPPELGQHAPAVRRQQTARLSSARLRYELLHELDALVLSYGAEGHREVIASEDGLWLNGRRLAELPRDFVGIAFAESGHAISVSKNAGTLALFELESKRPIECSIAISQVVVSDHRIYALSGTRLLELQIRSFGDTFMMVPRMVAQVLEHATQLFGGVAIQNLLGTHYLSLLSAPGKSYQIALPQLAGYQILDACCRGQVLMLSVRERSALHRLVFRFSPDFSSYDCRMVENVDISSLNFVVLDTGVCVCMSEDESLELFVSQKDSTQLDRIVDTGVGSDIKLASRGPTLVIVRGQQVLRATMKQPIREMPDGRGVRAPPRR